MARASAMTNDPDFHLSITFSIGIRRAQQRSNPPKAELPVD
jgi:hypothetical protein